MIFDPTDKEEQLMLDSKVIYRYIHAGKGQVTLVNPNSLNAHSYKFLKPKDSRSFPENTIFVYCIHEDHLAYLGMLDGSGIRRTRRSSFDEHTEAMKGARYIVKMASNQDLVDARQMDLYHSGRCALCGRPLRGNSIKEGMGPKCRKLYNEELMKVPWDGN